MNRFRTMPLGLIFLLLLIPARAAKADADAAAAGPKNDRFVVITDSHGVGHFGEQLAHWLRNRPNTKFDFLASGASAPAQWTNNAFTTPCGFRDGSNINPPRPRACKKLHTDALRDLWKAQGRRTDDERRISIIVLGTNFGMQPEIRAQQVLDTQKLLEDAMKTSDRCLWMGPPNMTRPHGFDAAGVEYKVKIIKEAIKLTAEKTGKPPCQFVDSRDFSTYPKASPTPPSTKPDGIHLHWPGNKDALAIKASGDWADGVAAQADCLLALPVRADAGSSDNSCH
ncbi:MAG: hypothetical protein HY074_15285 [Deltaproteobacteria bacterium]|nr:hypothetical protein [Deltaproteobacteria bacterium]